MATAWCLIYACFYSDKRLTDAGSQLIYTAIRNALYYRNLETWSQWLAAHGSECHTVETRLGGPLGQRFIFTHDAANVKALLATQFDDYGKGQRFHDDWEPLFGEGIFGTDGEEWRASRHLIRPQFMKERVSDLGIFEKHSQVLINVIKNNGLGKEIDIFEMFQRYTLDAATEFLLGRSVDNLIVPNVAFAQAFADVQNILALKGQLGPLQSLLPLKKLNEQVKVIRVFVDSFVDEVLAYSPAELEAKSKKEYTFLESLALFTRDRKVLRDQIVSVLLAGRDTTASALSWTFYELARHPEVVVKLRDEIISTLGLDRSPTYTDLKNMKYLQNCLHETLRLYPSVPFNVRIAAKDTTLPTGGGISMTEPIGLLENDVCIYSALSLHRREDLYPPGSNVLNYDPDRWLTWQPKPWDYVPFNGGPRICVGQQFALTEMGFTIVRLLQQFDEVVSFMDYEQHAKTGWNMKAEVVIQALDGVRIGFGSSETKFL
ncbi:Cytochrome P450 52A5 [Lachnellula suecica]|uniref:Cytochrome P450 52A5 n=1 Tax=Lachnellula suecica TaxID=602035 RepID=A0A8T9CI42_9HELO|nr:Cytochrome P450 52A5 [Lachnellula suecica]